MQCCCCCCCCCCCWTVSMQLLSVSLVHEAFVNPNPVWFEAGMGPKIQNQIIIGRYQHLLSFVQKMPKYCANFREPSSRALLCSNHYTPRCISASCLTYLKQDSWNVSQSFSIHVTLISFEKIWASANLITMFLLQLSVLHCWLLRNLETITF